MSSNNECGASFVSSQFHAATTPDNCQPQMLSAEHDPETLTVYHGKLIRAVAERQDEEAFKHLFEWYAPRVKSVMRRQGAGNSVAEDLAQETLLMVWRKCHLFDSEKAAPSTWIFTIARNLSIDRFRKESRPQLDPNDPALLPESTVMADDAIDLKVRREKVRQSLKQLPEEQKQVVHLSYIEGLAHPEIAKRLGIPLGTVKSRLRLSFKKLRPVLRKLS